MYYFFNPKLIAELRRPKQLWGTNGNNKNYQAFPLVTIEIQLISFGFIHECPKSVKLKLVYIQQIGRTHKLKVHIKNMNFSNKENVLLLFSIIDIKVLHV